MPRIEFSREAVLPRMRAYLTRAGAASLVSNMPPEMLKIGRSVYLEAYEAARPAAFRADMEARDLRVAIPAELAGCARYTFLAITLGRELDGLVERYLAAGETLRGSFADAWGSEAAEALAVSIDVSLRAEMGDGTIRFAPGYSGFDIRHNSSWLETAAGRDEPLMAVDVDTGIITPRKSIICAIGWRDGGRG